MANPLYGSSSYGYGGGSNPSSIYTSRSIGEHYSSVSDRTPSMLFNQTDAIGTGFSAAARMTGREALWPPGVDAGVSATSVESILAGYKRSSAEALYHQSLLGANPLVKRPRFEIANILLPVFPQRPGEKDCAHYMLTRTCKFGDSCRFDHPMWVPEGGIPDWKEVPATTSEDLPRHQPFALTSEDFPERPEAPDCPYFLKTQKCKFGPRCKFNHPKDKVAILKMLPRRSNRTGRPTNLQPPTAPQTPAPTYDSATFQAAVTVADTAAMASMNANGNGNDNGNGNRGTNSSTNGATQGQPRGCSYKDFTNGKPPTFRGDKDVITLTRWFEKIESVFDICVCPEELKVKYAACTFSDDALLWWNGQVKTMTLDVANSMSWEELKTMLLEEYCPRNEMQKLESELWNLTMKGCDIDTYTTRFNDLAVLCPAIVAPESKKVERYIWGLPSPIQGNVESANPATFDSAKRLAYRLVIHAVRQGTMNATLVPVAPAPTTPYAGTLPKCDKCNFHHHGPCRVLNCSNCGKKGHIARYCRSPAQRAPQTNKAGASQSCYGCRETGHFKRNCPKAKNKKDDGMGRVLAMGQMEAMEDTTVVMGNH